MKTIFLAIGFVYVVPKKNGNEAGKKLIAIMAHDDENVMRADAAF